MIDIVAGGLSVFARRRTVRISQSMVGKYNHQRLRAACTCELLSPECGRTTMMHPPVASNLAFSLHAICSAALNLLLLNTKPGTPATRSCRCSCHALSSTRLPHLTHVANSSLSSFPEAGICLDESHIYITWALHYSQHNLYYTCQLPPPQLFDRFFRLPPAFRTRILLTKPSTFF